MNTAQITERRRAFQDEHYAKQIPCPFGTGHSATLYVHGHRHGGYIECEPCDAYELCTHENTHTETIEITARYGEQDISYNQPVEVCDVCECGIEEV